MSFKVVCERIAAERAVDHVMAVSQASSKHTAGASSYVIAQAQARFADALGLEMKAVELIPNKMAGKPEAELRGGYHLSLHLVCSSPLASLPIAYGPVCALVHYCAQAQRHLQMCEVGKAKPHVAGLEVKTTKSYVLRSLLPAKCRALVKAPDVSNAFFMLVLSLIDFSPSKKLPVGE